MKKHKTLITFETFQRTTVHLRKGALTFRCERCKAEIEPPEDTRNKPQCESDSSALTPGASDVATIFPGEKL